jgi:hypothetical protein
VSRHRRDEELRDHLTDDEVLGLVVDGVLAGSKPITKLTKKILRAQRELHKTVKGNAWQVYLRLEELANERASMQIDLIVTWFTAGARKR